jgi:RHS repeat-associated protein
MTDASRSTQWAHDAMGRILLEHRTNGSVTNNTAYTDNLDGCHTAGNLTSDPSNYPLATHTYQWDAEVRVSPVDPGNNPPTWSFTYNALGQRVQWAYPGGTDQHLFDPNGTWLGNAGEYSIVWWGNAALALYLNGNTLFNHINHLGSTTVRTNQGGTAVEDMLFYPWGDVWQSWGSGGYNFAELPYYETTTNTSPTTFRFYSMNLDRWHSPDPMGTDITNPQSLNRYVYVLNNPTTLTDPMGLWPSGPGPICAVRPVRFHGAVHAMYAGGGGCGYGPVTGGEGGVSIDGGPPLPLGTFGGWSFGGGGDSAIPCPGGVCEYINQWGQLVQFTAFADGTYGYYAVWGPGGIYESEDQAGIASARWGSWWAGQNQSEIVGSLYYDPTNGFYSSDILATGGNMSVWMTPYFSDIPSGTNGVGWWNAMVMGEFSPSSDLEPVDNNPGTALYTGTPYGFVLYFGPGSGGLQCTLVGQPEVAGSPPMCP